MAIVMLTTNWGPLTELLTLVCVACAALFGIGLLLERQSAQTRRIVGGIVVALLLTIALASTSHAEIAVYWPWWWMPICFCLSLIGF